MSNETNETELIAEMNAAQAACSQAWTEHAKATQAYADAVAARKATLAGRPWTSADSNAVGRLRLACVRAGERLNYWTVKKAMLSALLAKYGWVSDQALSAGGLRL